MNDTITKPINAGNVDAYLDGGVLYAHMRNGRWYQARRNGATKRWKTRPTEFRIPIKIGFRGHAAIEHGDVTRSDFWRHVDDVPANLRPC